MKTKLSAIFLIIFCTLLTAGGQLLLKLGLNKVELPNVMTLFLNGYLIAGFMFYALGMILLLKALKMGELSVLYPFISLGFIWVALTSVFVLKEQVEFINWIGIFTIIIGVSLIGVGSKK